VVSQVYLIRIAEIFQSISDEIISSLDLIIIKKLGEEYFLVRAKDHSFSRDHDTSIFVRWSVMVHHSWPCCPQKMEDFIEKAAQTLFDKFVHAAPQSIMAGILNPGSPNHFYKNLASSLRGRALQIFPESTRALSGSEEQDPNAETLYCVIGKEGLFSGLQSPRDANGFYAGGTKYISQNESTTISRAGAKIAEALHYLQLYQTPLPAGSRWLELGASPGGMTSELLRKKYHVTAVDRAPLDQRLVNDENLHFVRADVIDYEPKRGEMFEAILSDLNGSPYDSIDQVIRLSSSLVFGGLIVFTLKTPSVTSFVEIICLYQSIKSIAEQSRLILITKTHLTYNRNEFTLFFEKKS
jgi:23S rRNA (cytidine2498-2'-O)-methyltransferase